MVKTTRKLIKLLFTAHYFIFHHMRLTGMENLPRSGGYILALNHTSLMDAFTCLVMMPDDVRFMAKKELFENRILAWFARGGGGFPVDREGSDLSALREASSILKDGHPLVIFPEGHRYKDGAIHELKPGCAMLAMMTGCPVVPGRIHTKYRPFQSVRINIGAPFIIERARGAGMLETGTQLIRDKMEAL